MSQLYVEDPAAFETKVRQSDKWYLVIIRYNFNDGCWTTSANWHNSSIIQVELPDYRMELIKYGCTGPSTHSAFSTEAAAQRFIDEYIQPKLMMRKLATGSEAV